MAEMHAQHIANGFSFREDCTVCQQEHARLLARINELEAMLTTPRKPRKARKSAKTPNHKYTFRFQFGG